MKRHSVSDCSTKGGCIDRGLSRMCMHICKLLPTCVTADMLAASMKIHRGCRRIRPDQAEKVVTLESNTLWAARDVHWGMCALWLT